jgi:formate hydrogenlyase subunit 6/NADH:ubiquinone oxidoreductase subunit I
MDDQTAYTRIARKIEEQEPHTAPKAADGSIHEAFIGHLRLVYSIEEAEIVQHLSLPEAFTSSQEVAEASGRSLEYVENVLAEVHSRNGIVGVGSVYCLPPIPLLLNLHHFYAETRDGDIEAAQLYQEYFVKGGFYKKYENLKRGTPVGRVIPVNRAIEANQKVLAAEEAHDYILNHSAEELALVPCPCRTRTEKMGIRECKDEFPIGACIMMGAAALHFEMIGLGKRVNKQQALEYFDEMQELGLVGHTLNARFGDRLICLCCGCCCSQTRGRTRWDNPDALSPSNFVPEPGEDCIRCETCADRCLFEAIALDEEADEMRVDVDKCIGCGVCTLACTQETLKLHRYERSSIAFETPQKLDEAMARENREG